jgi:hypothetical protein
MLLSQLLVEILMKPYLAEGCFLRDWLRWGRRETVETVLRFAAVGFTQLKLGVNENRVRASSFPVALDSGLWALD